MVQWSRPHTSPAGGMGLTPGQGTKDPACHVVQPKNIYIYLRNTYFASGTLPKTLEIATHSIIMTTL